MKKSLSLIILFLAIVLFGFSNKIFSQNSGVNYNLLLQQGEYFVAENFDDFLEKKETIPNEIIEGKYYRILQFFQIPTNEEKAVLKKTGIEFLNFFPNKAYIVSFPKNINKQLLKNKNIRAVIPIEGFMKKDKSLTKLDFTHESVNGENVEVMLRFYKNISMDWAIAEIGQKNVKILKPMRESHLVKIEIAISEIDDFAALPYVSFISIAPTVGEPEDRRGRSFHRSNMINTATTNGLKFDGSGVAGLVRDDGEVGPHIDFKGRLFQEGIGGGSGTHGDGVAGIFGGAGNLDPDMKGMASGADLHILTYGSDFQENLISLALHQNENVLVVNSSYSNGCNAGYTNITEIVDRHVFENPTFLHVFSAGNSNNQDCEYGAGNQWGNITGGHKQGKNVIATANVHESGELANSSSRGPAHDGRIKPDITANGRQQNSTDPFNQYSPFGGTSAAAPGVAGVSTQLHHVYQELNNGDVAPSALIKATLLNTANDMGNIGPDFKFGWGHMNAYRAFRLLEDVRYEEHTISQGGNNMHTFTVPANTVEVKFMIYWNEQSAAVGATKALINDLDMVVTSPDGTTKLPWVLDHTPDPATLNLPATNGEDHLNNVEQVLFEHPVAGSYTIDVSGFEVPFGPQDYLILYEIITDEVTLTYPIGGEGFRPTEQERLRWDAFGDDGDFLLEYTTNDGTSWETITTVAGTERMTLWTPPNQISGEVRVRVSRGGFSDESDENFSICNIPNNLTVEQFCPNHMRVSWNATSGATGYDVFYLGGKYMDSVGTTTMTEFDIPLNLVSQFQDHWFSVRAKGADGLRGKRAIAVRYTGGLLNCILENDVATTQLFSPNVTSIVSCDPIQKTISIEVENTSINDQSTLSFGYQINNGTPIVEVYGATLTVGEVIEHTFSTPVDFATSGVYNLKTWSTIPNDDVFFNDTIFRKIIVSIDDVAVPSPNFMEDFEGDDFPPQDWFTSNTDGTFGWEQIIGVTGKDGNHTRAALMRNRFYEAVGERDEIFSIPLDLTNMDNPIFTFDLAYALFTSLCSDTLLVEVYTECGDVFQEEIYRKAGGDLNSGGFSPSDWLPSQASDWRTESIFLTDYIGEEVLLKIVNIAGNCNNLLIDNINISNYSVPVAGFTASETAVCIGEKILFTNTSTAILSNYNWFFGQGGSVSLSTSLNPDSLFYILPGEKEVRLIVSNQLGADTFIQVITVIDDPDADYSVNQTGDGYQFTNESEESDSYLWDFGDGTMSVEENPFKIYNVAGDYSVKLTAVNACAEDFRIQNLDVTVTDVEDLTKQLQIQIFPNPSDGVFYIKIGNGNIEDMEAELWDVNGRLLGGFFVKNKNGNQFHSSTSQHLTQGIYFVKIKTARGVVVERVVVSN